MNKEVIFDMSTPFRGEYAIAGYRFGNGEKCAAIVGAMRGNEFQQLYICSQLIAKLEQIEAKGGLIANKEILVIPALNYNAMNVGSKYWVSDNTDINRSFPGIKEGPATSRIAAHVLELVEKYSYGVQFASSYISGEFAPHVRLAENGAKNTSLANLFGLPYVLTATERAFDKSTLVYNWQQSGTYAFSVYSGTTEQVDERLADLTVNAVLRFLQRMGILRYDCHGGYMSSVIDEDKLITVRGDMPGFFRRKVHVEDEVKKGQVLGEIVDSYRGDVISRLLSPTDGMVFFELTKAMLFQNSVAYRLIELNRDYKREA